MIGDPFRYTLAAGGIGTASSSAPVTAIIGPGVLYLINTAASATLYYAGGTATNTSTPLPAGKDIFTGLLADASRVQVFGTDTYGWALYQPAP